MVCDASELGNMTVNPKGWVMTLLIIIIIVIIINIISSGVCHGTRPAESVPARSDLFCFVNVHSI